jgi:NADPH2:quinone reductase
LNALNGRQVLVRGFGAVGFAAVHLARWAGAEVVVTSGHADKRAAALAAGAAAALDPSEASSSELLRAALPNGATCIVEVAVGLNLAEDAALLASGGRIGVYATEGPPLTEFPFRALTDAMATMEFVMAYRLPAEVLARATQDITTAVGEGYLRGRATAHFDLADIAQAHKAGEAGEQARIIIDIP